MPFDNANLTQLQQDALECAARVRKGWCQDTLKQADHLCAIGAIYDVCVPKVWDMGIIETNAASNARAKCLKKAFADVINRDAIDIAIWNDAPGRTAEEVAQIFESIALP